MRHLPIRRGGLAALLLTALSIAIWQPWAAAEDDFRSQITWHKDLDAARELAAKDGKPLYVVFRCIP